MRYFLFILLILFQGCGGSGGGSSNSETNTSSEKNITDEVNETNLSLTDLNISEENNNSNDEIQVEDINKSHSIKIKVIDGYIRDATVFLDLNGNLKFDNQTDILANFDDKENLYIIPEFQPEPLRNYFLVSQNGIDSFNSKEFNQTLFLIVDKPLIEKDTPFIISPLNNLISSYALTNENSNFQKAENKVKHLFNLEAEDLFYLDFIENKDVEVFRANQDALTLIYLSKIIYQNQNQSVLQIYSVMLTKDSILDLFKKTDTAVPFTDEVIFEDWAQEYQKAQINIRQNLVWEDNNLKVRNQYNLLVSPDEIIQFDGSRVILEIIDIPAVQQAKHEINIKKQEAIILDKNLSDEEKNISNEKVEQYYQDLKTLNSGELQSDIEKIRNDLDRKYQFGKYIAKFGKLFDDDIERNMFLSELESTENILDLNTGKKFDNGITVLDLDLKYNFIEFNVSDNFTFKATFELEYNNSIVPESLRVSSATGSIHYANYDFNGSLRFLTNNNQFEINGTLYDKQRNSIFNGYALVPFQRTETKDIGVTPVETENKTGLPVAPFDYKKNLKFILYKQNTNDFALNPENTVVFGDFKTGFTNVDIAQIDDFKIENSTTKSSYLYNSSDALVLSNYSFDSFDYQISWKYGKFFKNEPKIQIRNLKLTSKTDSNLTYSFNGDFNLSKGIISFIGEKNVGELKFKGKIISNLKTLQLFDGYINSELRVQATFDQNDLEQVFFQESNGADNLFIQVSY